MKKASPLLLLAVGLALFAACSAPSSSNTGSAQLAASVPQALSASDVARVRVTVSAPDMTSLGVELVKSNGTWGGVIGSIPAGSNRSFLAEAFDSTNTLRFQGQVSSITITANQTTAVALTLQEQSPPLPYGNDAPLIDSVVANVTTVQTGGTVSLTAAAHDPNAGDTLTYLWTATGGTFSTPTAANTSWTAPASANIQTLTLTVTDSQGAAASISLAINVLAGTTAGTANLSITFNLFPVVSKVTASRTRVDVGQSIGVTATASDADTDAMTYQWNAVGCTGTWSNATSSAATFVPSAIPSSACHNCKLTVTVQDGRGGQGSGSINLCIAAATTERFPPLFTNSYQSATTTAPGQTVTFHVTALDPQSSTLTFTWTSNIGSLGTAQNTASTSQAVWTAPSCAIAGIAPSITATVTNAFNLTASQSFTVAGLPVCASGWASAGVMAAARSEHSATLLTNGKVLIAGGSTGSGYLATAELYDPASNTWSATAPMPTVRYYHTATRLPDGKVLVAGGYNSGGVLNASELYDPVSGTWSVTGAMATRRQGHMAALLPSGKVLVMGGEGSGYLSAAEVYDPASGMWSAAPPMATPRRGHTATVLNTGKVLVLGGYSGSSYLASAELYDPASGTWSAAAPMASARSRPTATLLPNGKVLVTGGFNGYLASVEVYDPASNTWSAAAPMSAARAFHSAALLPTGKVLVAGGYNGSSYLTSAAVYDPDAGTWSNAASMAAARDYYPATVLPNGKVLVSGGYIGSGSITGAELYTP